MGDRLDIYLGDMYDVTHVIVYSCNDDKFDVYVNGGEKECYNPYRDGTNLPYQVRISCSKIDVDHFNSPCNDQCLADFLIPIRCFSVRTE